MSGLSKMTLNEVKLFLREPVAVFFGVLFPTLLVVVILGCIPGVSRAEQRPGRPARGVPGCSL